MQGDKKLDGTDSIEGFKRDMESDAYFEQRHFRKVDSAFKRFKNSLCL